MGNAAVECVQDRTTSGLTSSSSTRQCLSHVRSQIVDEVYRRVTQQKPIPYSIEKNANIKYEPTAIVYMGQEGAYLGDMERGQPHGVGQLYFGNGNFMQAIFQRGHVECKDGLLIESNGNYYRGGFKESRQSGYGVWFEDDGTTKGVFQEGAVRGQAEWTVKDGRVYKGQMLRGLPDGKGKMTYPSGEVYEGYFRRGKRNGIGCLECGEYAYYGPFAGDKKEGKGTLFFKDGGRFEGWFEQDRIYGYGEWHRPNGTKQKGNYDLKLSTDA